MSAEATPACAQCGAALARDQRYCLQCGARHGARAPQLEQILAGLSAAGWTTRASAPAPDPHAPRRVLPSPRVGAVLTLVMLAFGTLAGAAASNPPGALSALRRPLTLLMPVHPRTPAKAVAVVPPPLTATPTPAGGAVEAPPVETSAPEEPAQGGPRGNSHGGAPAKAPGTAGKSKLPPIKHVFVIMLADEPYAQTFGPESPAHYLARTLEHRGELLVRDYAVAREELANEVALISGLGPTPQTAANCPLFADIVPTLPDKQGQYDAGKGCIYPPSAETLASQLEAKQLSWRVYAEAMGTGDPAHAAPCWHPAFGASDPTAQPAARQRFATFRDPFDYFDGVLHAPSCAHADVGLEALAADLHSAKRTPAFSYIVPDLCEDGRPTPCAAGGPSGLPAADAFLRRVVPKILAAPAYRKNGLLIITTDQAPTTGEYADSSSCCFQPRFPGPEALPSAGAPAPVGGAQPGATTTTGTTVPASTAPATTTPTAAAPTATSPSPSATAPGIKLPPTGGGQVGALLLSPFVKGGTYNQEPVNDFTLLRTIEDLFGLPRLGYAKAKGVSSLEAAVFSAYTGG